MPREEKRLRGFSEKKNASSEPVDWGAIEEEAAIEGLQEAVEQLEREKADRLRRPA